MKVVCFEWSVINGSIFNGNHFEAFVCFYETRLSNCLAVVAITDVVTILTSKIKM